MQFARAISVFFVLISLAVSATAGPAFSKKELRQLLVGNTFPLSKGAMYVAPDGNLHAIWEGKTEITTWKIRSGGRICYFLKMFKEKECLRFERNDAETYLQVFGNTKRKFPYSAIKPGKAF
ncbi:hypothetical protein [Phaeobacter inhibens]|uniref:hypothetical protein n=1 Tax=Phaeobacter inhibens TaxID=221822 RepID=UPI000CA1D992|nr:hypothetical protein [Phaeobacter inhibens]AUR04140.1 hypothetical protein PhaeoP72_02178 [Phaeobacter inhibens]UWR47743.1 hypothetical protein K4F87_10340 [Phaeobacter inhibens]UWR59354.1 hypothetical protein K4F88_10420 [Phaeobacter inhibens]UWR87240.1 hypothetical protein K4L01_10685 [Phaeobacter inhibens]UWS06652.1 hypothetical protein K4K98_10285 [Phaeobacter inhibens]